MKTSICIIIFSPYFPSAKSLFDAASGSVADKRKMHQAAGDKVNTLFTEIRMYEKAIAVVGESLTYLN